MSKYINKASSPMSKGTSGRGMSLLKYTKAICKQHNILPLRKRGQNFLVNSGVIQKIIHIAELEKHDIVLEIGAGTGILTKEIAKKAEKVIAVEIDKKLVEILRDELQDYKNIEIVHGDIRDFSDLGSLSVLFRCVNKRAKPGVAHFGEYKYKVVANLPFNITGLVLKQFLSAKDKIKSMTLVVQKEVGQRILAKPPNMNLLAVSVQFYARARIMSSISKNNFWPKPKVDSVILRIVPNNKVKINPEKFFVVVKAGFLHSRKYLLNNLTTFFLQYQTPFGGRVFTNFKNNVTFKDELIKIFKSMKLNPKVRAQELSVEDWVKLVNKLINDK